MIHPNQVFNEASPFYLEAGWSPIPLPPKDKFPVPIDTTGAKGVVTPADVQRWAETGRFDTLKGQMKVGNVALRLPKNVIGIDVDMYGEKTGREVLRKAEEKWGKLPATWMSTSREDGSGIRLFTIPEGLAWPESLTKFFGKGVEILRWDHRFAVVEPSIHPEGRLYRWVHPDGTYHPGEFPAPADLTPLPTKWVEALTQGSPWEERASAKLTKEQARLWIEERNDGDLCEVMQGTLRKWSQQVREASAEGDLHDSCRNGIWALMGDSANGHCGVAKALKKLRGVWMEWSKVRRTQSASDAEWKRMCFDGVKKVSAEGATESEDPCQLLRGGSKPDRAPATSRKAGKAVRVTLTNEPSSIQELIKALRYGAIPDTYQRRGRVVRTRRVQDEAGKIRLLAQVLTPDSMREELSQHVEVVKMKVETSGRGDKKVEEVVETEVSPTATVCGAVLSGLSWDPLPPLRGIVSQPVFREDGSLLQTPGYDSASGLYYEPEREIPSVDPKPSPDTVAAAKRWLTETLLADFPWESRADLANYIALLVTPLVRSFVKGLSPFGVVTATAPGSGKSLLAQEIPSRLYRLSSHTWARREDERQKVITSAFAEDAAVVVFDNIGDTDKLDSPALAKLLTSQEWMDRRLGKNDEVLSFVNNRLWMATGNNIALGGDMASRSVLVRLTPSSDPTKRSQFALGDLTAWLRDDANVNLLLRCLLILVIDWVRGGAPTGSVAMRNFSGWASAMSGLLKHHGILGFMENEHMLREADLEAEDWTTFMTHLRSESAGKWLTSQEIFGLYSDGFGGSIGDVSLPPRWDGSIPPSAVALSNMLRVKRERPIGGLRLVSKRDSANRAVWLVLTDEEYSAEKLGVPELATSGTGAGNKRRPGSKKPTRTA